MAFTTVLMLFVLAVVLTLERPFRKLVILSSPDIPAEACFSVAMELASLSRLFTTFVTLPFVRKLEMAAVSLSILSSAPCDSAEISTDKLVISTSAITTTITFHHREHHSLDSFLRLNCALVFILFFLLLSKGKWSVHVLDGLRPFLSEHIANRRGKRRCHVKAVSPRFGVGSAFSQFLCVTVDLRQPDISMPELVIGHSDREVIGFNVVEQFGERERLFFLSVCFIRRSVGYTTSQVAFFASLSSSSVAIRDFAASAYISSSLPIRVSLSSICAYSSSTTLRLMP